MDTKEVLAVVKALNKQRDDEQQVLLLLGKLESGVSPTEKLLRETKVGVEVNKFKKSKNDEIAKAVRRIISSWKDAINKSKRERSAAAGATSTAGASTTTPAPAPAVAAAGAAGTTGPASPRKEAKFLSGKPRNSKNDGVDTVVHHNKLRDSVVRALYDALAKDSEHPPSSVLQTAVDIEKEMNALYDHVTSEKQYKEKYRIVYSNIISRNNPDLKFKITNGDLTPQFVVQCDPKELAPEHLRQKIEEITKQNLFNAQGATIERSVTDRFQCGKCKEKKVSYYQLQTRSADEPLTTFCTCEACGNRWKFS
ncbi:transcription elongation factor DST1 KNAG_0D03260 [Huiozyma naganishii CBS 8797]|uniref:Transcription elongation factor n=1 Tax=Huiozyma naganishii (strain ATCC MYA-139 / BCRC 22969 / CBS 8797 / KCTC 17520 / NBRC 10181 / NCYC 3082 / Yp74L-3) TaxID=1071383 RepID=J7RY71_HUIN7|nr:hypothetical protein KNAG_0D03260 [Kazachstania naganishii CBS 8797]CCK70072.1 hypothetical protein KNAG_0D03260 [Kazachstania naganishii CBS 8797]